MNHVDEQRLRTHRRILKLILNFWTYLTMVIFCVDFFSGNRFDASASAVGVIYIALLGIYVGDKEYIRWRKNKPFSSLFLGETFVVVWTVVMAVFVVVAPISQGRFFVPSEFAVIYASIIGAFAISSHSKALHGK